MSSRHGLYYDGASDAKLGLPGCKIEGGTKRKHLLKFRAWGTWPCCQLLQLELCVSLSHVQLCNPMGVAPQAPLSMGFSRQECWSGFHFLLQGILLTPGFLHCRQTLYHLSQLKLESIKRNKLCQTIFLTVLIIKEYRSSFLGRLPCLSRDDVFCFSQDWCCGGF